MAEQQVTVAGIVNYVRQITTKKGDPMAFAQIEDLQGTVELVIFPKTWEDSRDLWVPERILVVRGKVSLRGREPSVIVDSVTNEIMTVSVPDQQPAPVGKKPIHIRVTVARTSHLEEVIQRLGHIYDLFQSYPGDDRFSLYVENGSQGRIQIEFPNDTTGHCVELEHQLHLMLGAAKVEVVEE
jgi:DNA polymerase-3 subunit alpha